MSRVVCGLLWTRDVAAGAALGVSVAATLRADPRLDSLLVAARIELGALTAL